MAIHPQLQQFVDDELMRAPLLFDQVLQTTIDLVRSDAVLRDRGVAQALLSQQTEMTRRFAASVRDQVNAEITLGPGSRPGAKRLTLSLVDDAAVQSDVELSRTIETLASTAEHELRELRTFTSALVGDVHVARDTNPFRPDVYARALWAAVGSLPLPMNVQLAVMRHAAPVFGQVLRKAYAAACTRLEDAGVEPGTYSTIVMPTGTRTARPSEREPEPLADIRESMPVPLDEPVPGAAPIQEVLIRQEEMLRLLPESAGAAGHAQTLVAGRARLLGSAATRADQQVIELLSRLFDAILTDRDVAPQVLVLLSRLHASALRCALHDAATLDSYEHPLWQFMDRIAFIGDLHPAEDDPVRGKLLAYAKSLIDNMVREPVHDANLFRWGVGRLEALQKHRFDQRCQAAQAQIRSLSTVTERTPAASGAPLDVGSLETVPAELMEHDTVPPAGAGSDLDSLQAGQWLRIFHHGAWRVAQLLWCDEPHALWLLTDAGDGGTWALTREAVDRLHGSGLMAPMRPPSLVRRAAQSVLREVTGGSA